MRVDVKIITTFKDYFETEDYREEFCEQHALGDDDTVDEEALKEFALEQYSKYLAEGNQSFDELSNVDIDVQEKK